MTTKKKVIAMLLAGVMTATMLTGCGANGGVSGKTTPMDIVESSAQTIGYLVKGPDKSADVKAVVVLDTDGVFIDVEDEAELLK